MNVGCVVLLPTDDGRWRVTADGGDVEGHSLRGRFGPSNLAGGRSARHQRPL